MKKFYTLVSSEKVGNEFHIFLDKQTIKTQNKNILCAPRQEIADGVVQEWAAQEETIVPDTMPFTQILSTKIDRVSISRKEITEALLKYIDTDLICYHTDMPKELYDLQEKHWLPIRQWIEKLTGEKILTTTSLEAVKQSKTLHTKIADYANKLNEDEFTVFQLVTALAGSAMLSMAFMAGQASASDVHAAIYVEEHYKDELYDSKKYGKDPLTEKKEKADLNDLSAYADYLSFIKKT